MTPTTLSAEDLAGLAEASTRFSVSRAERLAALVFRANLKYKHPATRLCTIHTWGCANSAWCNCGRFAKDDRRLTVITLPFVGGLLCKRCIWSQWSLEQELNTAVLPL